LSSKAANALKELTAHNADPVAGNKVFTASCNVCYKVNNSGYEFSPKLNEIVSKLPKEALSESIVRPSAGIGFGIKAEGLR